MILDSPTSLLHQGSPSSWIFATKGVLKSPGEFLESSLKGLMVKISSFINFLPLKLMFVENFRTTIQNPGAHIPLTNAPKECIEVGCPPLRKLFAQIEASTNWQDVNFAGSWNPQDKASALYEKLLFMRGYDPNQFYIAYTNDHSMRSKKVSRPAACTAS